MVLIPQVNRDDVNHVIERECASERSDVARVLLNEVRFGPRVQLAVLKLCEGILKRLEY